MGKEKRKKKKKVKGIVIDNQLDIMKLTACLTAINIEACDNMIILQNTGEIINLLLKNRR